MAGAVNPGPYYETRINFSGGQNDSASDLMLGPTEFGRGRNVDLERDGAVSKRKGSIAQLGARLTGEFGMIHQFRSAAATSEIVVGYGTKLSTWQGGATPPTDLLSGLGNNRVFLPAEHRDRLFLTNGFDLPMVYWPAAPGSPKVYRPGAPAPTGAPTEGASIAGQIEVNGDVYVRIRFYNVYGQIMFGEPHLEAGTKITIANAAGGTGGGRTIDNIPVYTPTGGVVDYRIAGRVIERTTVGGGQFYLAGYLADNVTTTFSFTQSDALLTESDLMPAGGYRLPMPLLWPMVSFKNRIVGADPTQLGRIVWSEIDEFGIVPDFFPALYDLFLDVKDWEDAPQAMAAMGDWLVVYCGKSVHAVSIDEAGNGVEHRLGAHNLGFPSARALVELYGGHLIWSYKGPYFFDGENFTFVGERIEGELKTITRQSLANMFVVNRTQEQRRQIKFVLPAAGATKNNVAAVYHYRRPVLKPEGFPTNHAWTFYDNIEHKSGGVFLHSSTKLEVEYSGDYNGQLFIEDTGDTNGFDEAGGFIPAELVDRWEHCKKPEFVKNFEDIWVFLAGAGADQLAMTWETDFGKGPSGVRQLEIAGDVALWDQALWDQAKWFLGSSTIQHARLGVSGHNAVGRFIRFRFANRNPNQPFTILGWILKYTIDRDRGDLAGV